MKVERLVELVLGRSLDGQSGLLKDPRYTEDDVVELVNAGVNDIASRVLLPRLITTGTVDTVADTGEAALPTDFMRELHAASSASVPRIVVYQEVERLLSDWSDPTPHNTSVVAVAVQAGSLICRPIISSSETLTLSYYKLPDTLSSSSEIDLMPDHYVRDTVLSYVLKEAYQESEDMADMGMPNADRYEAKYEAGIRKLRVWANMQNPPSLAREIQGRRAF